MRGFVAGTIASEAFARALDFTGRGADIATPGGEAANPSRWRLDLAVKPRIETQMMTEVAVVEERVSALPEATLQVARGVTVSARRAVELYTSDQFFTHISDPNADRLLVNVARPLPGGLGERGFSQMSVGRFGHNEVGLSDEVDLTFAGGRGSIGGTVAVFGKTVERMDRSVALGTLRLRDAPSGVTVALTAGRYFHGDVGGGVEVQRLFGPVEIAFNVTSTDAQSVGRLRVSVPLGSRRDLAPGSVRLRWPGYHDQDIQSTIFASYPVLRTDVGIPLETGAELARVLRQRDRLLAPMVLAHLDDIRAAANRK
jgi:hypothetical protein